MRNIRQLLVVLGVLLCLHSANLFAASAQDRTEFANKMQQLLRKNDFDYARAAMLKYLEIDPGATPVKRELAHYYMKTTAVENDSLFGFEYPNDKAKQIIDLLDEVIAEDPSDHQALSLLVYTHALRGNIEQGEHALAMANALTEKAQWLPFNAALLSISANNLEDARERLSAIAIDRNYPKSSDDGRIYRDAWSILRKLSLAHSEFDSLKTLRDGLATRVDIDTLPEFLENHGSGDQPIVLIVTSQDKNCPYCVSDLPVLDRFARRNRDEGDKYKIIYASTEPWNDIKYYKELTAGLKITGVPAYSVIRDDWLVYHWGGSNPKALDKLLDNFDEIMATAEPKIQVATRQDYILDRLEYEFKEYEKTERIDFRAMAYAIEGRYWQVFKNEAKSSQDAADESALAACNNTISKAGKAGPCRLYAQGNDIVDATALNHTKNKAAALKKAKAEHSKKLKANAKKTAKNKQKPQSKKASKPVTIADAVRQYKLIKAHYKALAIAQADYNAVSGTAEKELTQHRANQLALQNCDKARAEAGIDALCELHSIGLSEVTEQSETQIQKLTTRQQKKNVQDSALGASYKKYRKFSTDKAYAISIDNAHDWASGMAFGKRGEDKARLAAIENCEKSSAQKNLSDPCRILIVNSKFVEQTP